MLATAIQRPGRNSWLEQGFLSAEIGGIHERGLRREEFAVHRIEGERFGRSPQAFVAESSRRGPGSSSKMTRPAAMATADQPAENAGAAATTLRAERSILPLSGSTQ